MKCAMEIVKELRNHQNEYYVGHKEKLNKSIEEAFLSGCHDVWYSPHFTLQSTGMYREIEMSASRKSCSMPCTHYLDLDDYINFLERLCYKVEIVPSKLYYCMGYGEPIETIRLKVSLNPSCLQ